MMRSLWRTIDRFSPQYFKYLVNELQQIKVVDMRNRELVADILQSIVELVAYGDKHDPSIFECFMEYQVLGEFVRLLKTSRNSRIEATLLQYMSILIQNIQSEQAIYYCFSNDYINFIMTYEYDFDKGDLVQFYISFLRAVSGKINRDTLCLLVKVRQDVVISFPLYSEALKFALHSEKMIQVAVRALTLNVFHVSDDMVYQFITTSPASDYFLELLHGLNKQCFELDALVIARGETCTSQKRRELFTVTDKIVDDFYYLEDILSVGNSRLSRLIIQNLLRYLVFPILLPMLQLRQSNDKNISALASLCIISRLLQVVDGEDLVNSVAGVIFYPYMTSSIEGSTEVNTDCKRGQYNQSANGLSANEEVLVSLHRPEGTKKFPTNSHFMQFSEYVSSSIAGSVSCLSDHLHAERWRGILSYVESDSHRLLLATVYLLIINLAESTDLDCMLDAMIGSSEAEVLIQKIMNRLLSILASHPPFSVLVQWHTGWFLQKLLVVHEKTLSNQEVQLFKISYASSLNCLRKELDESWFDHLPDTLRIEWDRCKTALEVSTQYKDPFFILELDFHQEDGKDGLPSSLTWERMIDAVKVFVLHRHLKAYIFKEHPVKNPLINFRSSMNICGKSSGSDTSFAGLGSEFALGHAVYCKIALTKVGVKNLYALPMSRGIGISGKLLLLEEHPLDNQLGVVFASAPLAGLKPKIDENHPTWLHIRVRDSDSKYNTNKTRVLDSKKSFNNAVTPDGRWTLGFPDADACEAARRLIVEEINKQRSAVEDLLAPLLRDDLCDTQ